MLDLRDAEARHSAAVHRALPAGELLDAQGISLAGFSKAVEALHELESAAEVLSGLVTDIRLQDDKDGWQVARRGRELNATLPVVYMSGDSASDHSSQGVPQSIMVQKPFALAQIVTAVSTLINEAPRAPTVD